MDKRIANIASDTAVLGARLVRRFRSGANWFYWIGGLSVVSSLVWWIRGKSIYWISLAFTQLSDSLIAGRSWELDGDDRLVAMLVALAASLLIAGVFVFLGYVAGQGKIWAFILGMVLYAVDAAICFVSHMFLTLLFHLVALFALSSGLVALVRLRSLMAQTNVP